MPDVPIAASTPAMVIRPSALTVPPLILPPAPIVDPDPEPARLFEPLGRFGYCRARRARREQQSEVLARIV